MGGRRQNRPLKCHAGWQFVVNDYSRLRYLQDGRRPSDETGDGLVYDLQRRSLRRLDGRHLNIGWMR